MTILLLDDEATVRQVVAFALTRAGYDVHEASTVDEAIAYATSHGGEIPLLITNHRLPDGKTGRDVAEHILSVRPEMAVLHISGYPERTLLAEGSITPGGYYLAKPFLPAALVAKVNQILKSA